MNERTELRNLIRHLQFQGFPSFESWTISQQIVFLGWFLQKVCSKKTFSEDDLRNAVNDLDLTPPASFGHDIIKSCPEIIEDQPVPKRVLPDKILPIPSYRLKVLAFDLLDQQYSGIYATANAPLLTSTEDNKLLSEPASNIPPHSCFVIQPFDEGIFDRRYNDIFEPAITEAGFHSYRVDKDFGVSVPIDQIEKGIKQAAACFVEITTDSQMCGLN